MTQKIKEPPRKWVNRGENRYEGRRGHGYDRVITTTQEHAHSATSEVAGEVEDAGESSALAHRQAWYAEDADAAPG
jgi:hypothetical protein